MATQETVLICEFKYSYISSGSGKRKFGTHQVEGGEAEALALIAQWNSEGTPTKMTRIIRCFLKTVWAPDAAERKSLEAEGASWDARRGIVLFSPNW